MAAGRAVTLDPLTFDPTAPFVVPDSWTRSDRDAWLERSVVIGAAWLRATLPRDLVADLLRQSCEERARWALTRAQRIVYTPDPDGGRVEQFSPVQWTVAHLQGDCEDSASALRAYATVAGVLSRFALQPYADAPIDHETAMVFCDGRWLWADASIPGARLGEEPGAAAARLPKPTGFGIPGPIDDWLILRALRRPRQR